MEIRTVEIDTIQVISILEDRLSENHLEEFEQVISPVLSKSPWIIFDMRYLKFFDSSVGQLLLRFAQQQNSKHGEIVFYGLNDAISAIFRLNQINRNSKIFYARKECLDYFRKKMKIRI